MIYPGYRNEEEKNGEKKSDRKKNGTGKAMMPSQSIAKHVAHREVKATTRKDEVATINGKMKKKRGNLTKSRRRRLTSTSGTIRQKVLQMTHMMVNRSRND